MQSWASFEPSKTTVKRVLLHECHKERVNKSSCSMDKQQFSPLMLDGSAVALPSDRSNPFLPSENKGEAQSAKHEVLLTQHEPN